VCPKQFTDDPDCSRGRDLGLDTQLDINQHVLSGSRRRRGRMIYVNEMAMKMTTTVSSIDISQSGVTRRRGSNNFYLC